MKLQGRWSSKRYGEEEFLELRGFKLDHENLFSPLPPLY